MALLYIVLGSANSGRRDVIADLIRNGTDPDTETVTLYLPEGEDPCPADEVFGKLRNTTTANWQMDEGTRMLAEAPAEGSDILFFLTQGSSDPIDQLEAIHDWAVEQGNIEIGRIFTVLNSQLAANEKGTRAWYEACIHFSDIVFFNIREDIPNKWFKDFEDHYAKECFPCLFELVKKGRVRNAAELLYPEARRMSLAFDDLDPSMADSDYEVEIEATSDEDESDETQVDPYFERLESGYRIKRLPDISKFL